MRIEHVHELRGAGIELKRKALLGAKSRRHKALTAAQGVESCELSPRLLVTRSRWRRRDEKERREGVTREEEGWS